MSNNPITTVTIVSAAIAMAASALIGIGIGGGLLYWAYRIFRSDFSAIEGAVGGFILLLGVGIIAIFLTKLGATLIQLQNRGEQG